MFVRRYLLNRSVVEVYVGMGWWFSLVGKKQGSVFKGGKVINQELAQDLILARSALIESAARWGTSTSIYRVVSSAKRVHSICRVL